MKKIITIAALAIVAGGCSPSLVSVKDSKPCPAPTGDQALQLVLTSPELLQRAGYEWLQLHPCEIEEAGDGSMLINQVGSGQPAVSVPCPAGSAPHQLRAPAGSGAPYTPGLPRQAPLPPDGGGSPCIVDVTAIQEAQDTTAYYRQASAGKDGVIATKGATISECVKWITWEGIGILVLLAIAVFLTYKLFENAYNNPRRPAGDL
jgi:hypothetical protein